MQGTVVSPESHIFPLWNVHGEGHAAYHYDTAVRVNHVVMAMIHGLLYSPCREVYQHYSGRRRVRGSEVDILNDGRRRLGLGVG
jgi:hypothetical protein